MLQPKTGTRASSPLLLTFTSEGYVIEFNDGSLDLPRGKAKAQEGAASAGPAPSLSNGPAAEPMEQAFAGVGAPPIPSELEIGGS